MEIIDIHCHMLPHVDDGPGSVEDTRALLKKAYKQGVRRIIVTPHYRPEMFEPSMRRVIYSYSRTKELAAEMGLELRLGCEFYRNEKLLSMLKEKERPTMAGSRYVLVEFSTGDLFQTIHNTAYELIVNGYKPIIAHIERYACCSDIKRAKELRELGAYIQVNAATVLGDAGLRMKKYCINLMKADLIDFIASDSHDIKVRKPNLGECAKLVSKKIGKDYAERIFWENPSRIWENR